MKSVFYILFLLLAHAICQADSLELIKNILIKTTLFTTDKNGNLYVSTPNNTMICYNQNGDSIGYYNATRKGPLWQIDANNPMKIALYYKNSSQLLVLDRMMSEKNVYNFTKINVYNSPCIATSADGNTWVFNVLNNTVQKVNENLETINSSLNFNQLLDKNIIPNYMVEQDQNLFIIDSSVGIIKMDKYGAYITTYHFYPTQLQFVNNQLYYFLNQKIYIYNTQTLQEKVVALPNIGNIINARIERNRVYVQTDTGIFIYKY